MTQATPMMMPSAVSIDRILLRAIAAMPTFRMVMNFSISTSRTAPRPGVAAR
jgi:hypothetical protein